MTAKAKALLLLALTTALLVLPQAVAYADFTPCGAGC
jgi:hypothetical protein